MSKNAYLPRIADKTLEKYLQTFGAVSIVGCKWSGKTTTAERLANSKIELQDPDNQENYKLLAATKPSLLLRGDKPRLVDEWQDMPVIWDSVRHDVDKTGLLGQYILTGSYTPRDNQPRHAGTGRFARLVMSPMTLEESRESTGEISLTDLLNHKDISGVSNLDIEDYAYLCCRGGWPGSLRVSKDNALSVANQYIISLTNNDVFRVANVEKDSRRAWAVLESLARNDCTAIKMSTLMKDIASNDSHISEKVIREYLSAYEQLFITFELPAFSPNLRNKSVIRTSRKIYFVDPSLAVAALNASPDQLLRDIHTFGFIFENLCMRDLKVCAESIGGKISYYNDSAQREIDAIVTFSNADWGAIEIKLGGEEAIETAAQNLKSFAAGIDETKTKQPAFLAVITGTKYAFQRPDGVYELPIGCLKS